jgi:photosystem II stability/assembly factor-like uncharacterized protein
MMKLTLLIPALLLLQQNWMTGQSIPSPTSGAGKLESFEKRLSLKESSLFSNVPFTNIGPTVCSGRIVDVDVNPSRPTEMYVAYASGGVWYTDNNATSFTPVFDQEACMTIGDIAVNWSSGVIWVGTGENNSSRSSYSGVGIYKSADKGKTWKHLGLEESHHIGRIILHPINPNIVHVACLGALYSDNPSRGVFSTSDGGVTWRHSLFVNATTGAIDMVIDPSNPNALYAATWERERRAWNFMESGMGTAIYSSTDSGRTWNKLTTAGSGFPSGPGAGRIGLEITRSRNETTLYAIIDNQHERRSKEKPDELTKAQLAEMSVDSFLNVKEALLKKYLEENDFPEEYTVDSIRMLVKLDSIKPSALVDYVQTANSKLFESEITGTEIYKSTDLGKTWQKTHEGYLDNIFYTYGYYFGQIRASKLNPKKLYIMGVPLLKSEDGGATWKSIDADNVHADHHALWVNPRLDGHLISGNDGGLNISYDDGAHWIKCNQPAVGQLYSINVDMEKPYNVYGGFQDNGVWVGPSTYQGGVDWHASGHYPYSEIMGGDGMQTAIDTRDNNTVYTGFQFGNYYKTSREGDSRSKRITPQHKLGERPYRWNWETPIHLSIHNQDILYMGAERVFRSFDQGAHFKPISGDLTHGGKEGDVAFGTLVSLHESPLTFGVLYAGSDDGYIHITKDGGNTWKKISDDLPQNLWVSSVQASQHAAGRVYTSLNGYRSDHFESYVYRSEDFGATWVRIGTDLPAEPVNVIKEDPVNPDILYIGTDHSLYISLDRGKTNMVMGNMPFVPVHDLVVHPRDKEIVVATHGRSIYKANVEHVQQLKPQHLDSLTCFNEKLSIPYRERWGTRSASWTSYSEPSVTFPVYTRQGGNGKLLVYSDSLLVSERELVLKKGLSYYNYTLEMDSVNIESLQVKINSNKAKDKDAEDIQVKRADNGKYYLPPGKYTVEVILSNQKSRFLLDVKGKS